MYLMRLAGEGEGIERKTVTIGSGTGINRHEGEKVGLFNTVLTAEDYELLAKQQQDSMKR